MVVRVVVSAIPVLGLAAWAAVGQPPSAPQRPAQGLTQPVLGARTVAVLTVDGARFKDLDKNGRLDAYEDWRLPVAARPGSPRPSAWWHA